MKDEELGIYLNWLMHSSAHFNYRLHDAIELGLHDCKCWDSYKVLCLLCFSTTNGPSKHEYN